MEILCNQGAKIVGSLNARVHGNGTEALILSHGFGADQSQWHYLVPFLAFYFKVVVFDLVFSPNVNPIFYQPNRYSDLAAYAEDLVCLLDQLGVKKTTYLGHSMSAMIGCLAAIKRPQMFDQLILISGSPRYLNEKDYTGGFERSEIDTIFNQMDKNFSGWVQNFAQTAVGVRDSKAIAEFSSTLGRMNPKVALSVGKTVFLSDLRQELPRVRVPCTIIQSSKDRIVPTSVASYMKEKLGQVYEVRILETEGHFPHLTASDLLIEVLKNVLHVKG